MYMSTLTWMLEAAPSKLRLDTSVQFRQLWLGVIPRHTGGGTAGLFTRWWSVRMVIRPKTLIAATNSPRS